MTLAITLPDGREAIMPVLETSAITEQAHQFCLGLFQDAANATTEAVVSDCLGRLLDAAERPLLSPKADATTASDLGGVVLRMPVEIAGRTLVLDLRRFESRVAAAARFLHKFSVPRVSEQGQDRADILAEELRRRCQEMGVHELEVVVDEVIGSRVGWDRVPPPQPPDKLRGGKHYRLTSAHRGVLACVENLSTAPVYYVPRVEMRPKR